MKVKICFTVLKNILSQSMHPYYPYYLQQTTKLNFFQDFSNQLRLISYLNSDDLTEIEKLLNRPEIQNYLRVIDAEYDKLENPINHRNPVIKICNDIKNFKIELTNLKNLDPENNLEMKKLIDAEEKKYLDEIKQLRGKLILYALPEENDYKSVTLSVLSGLGGQEAKLFAEELFHMYINYAKFKNWEISHVDKCNVEGGGVNRAEATVTGESVFKFLRYEAGVHRVQRVPVTEKSGKMQTSTCKVHVIPDVDDEIVLNSKDLKIETKTSSAPGGQNVNKIESCVRVIYIPTGLSVECQTSRYQAENKEQALKKLKNILYQQRQEAIHSQIKDIKMEQGTTMNRSDKIRTYNFTQNRVTDHRINYTIHQVDKYMEGNTLLNEMIKQVDSNCKLEYLLRNINRMLSLGRVSELFEKTS